MIPLLPRYFIVLSWIIFGPSKLTPPIIGLIAVGGAVALILRRSYRKRTLALLGILGLMLLESVFIFGLPIHFFLRAEPLHPEMSWGVMDLFHKLTLGESLLGIVAALCAGAFIEFSKSRMSLTRAFPQFKFLEAPTGVKEMISKLSTAAGVKAPDIYLIDSGVPSAFTVRTRRRYAVTVSVGLLESLDDSEVEACLAHEIAHLRNNDFTVRFLATLAKIALFARPLSYFLEPAVYRTREFLADITAAKLVGAPDALISAFSKLNESSDFDSAWARSTCVCNLKSRKGLLRIFDKHPCLEDRIRTLQEMKSN